MQERVRKLFIALFGVAFAAMTVILTLDYLIPLLDLEPILLYLMLFLVALVGLAMGYGVGWLVVTYGLKLLDMLLGAFAKLSLYEIIPSSLGLIIGLIIAALVNVAVLRIPQVGPYIAVLLLIAFGYLGMSLGYRKRDDINTSLKNLGQWDRAEKSKKKKDDQAVPPKILDTSVIIDGRVADIYRTGFLEGQLIVAGFVLEELQHIADSSDMLKRNRGRTALDCLKAMQNEFKGSVVVENRDYPETAEVDSKLLLLAAEMKGVVVTNDYNLNKVAQLKGVKVLNINDLSNAVKPIVLPGEEMQAMIVREGKEPRQGVAYLDDGTMIVVEQASHCIGRSVNVVITSILQTSAGRMVFARLK